MISAIDPHRRFQRRMALQMGAGTVVVLLAILWAWRVPAPASPTIPTADHMAASGAQTAAPTVDAAAWNVTLWRGFTDEAAPVAQAAPTSLKLFSIFQQGDGFTAAIACDDGQLVYVKAGDSANGFTVVRVEANNAVVRLNGHELRLGLAP
jgi:hypothetical protein